MSNAEVVTIYRHPTPRCHPNAPGFTSHGAQCFTMSRLLLIKLGSSTSDIM
eukprot:CAMPEP_0179061338 /NCGR_PEP_ID=MMETSP0796-20121207/26344_1 /TAXON_ID=73915 /ORGANISM="Pyrodinium bahamense, Strain pbaha01" /LENGTH=50 /DNA_ID=CAMNT_0020758177 /DNA_START=23 /DNA_END=175 /DNA_ORIENTATION=+